MCGKMWTVGLGTGRRCSLGGRFRLVFGAVGAVAACGCGTGLLLTGLLLALLLFKRSDFVPGKESTAWPTRTSHSMLMSRLVQVRLQLVATKKNLYLLILVSLIPLLDLCSRGTTLQDPVILLGIDIQRFIL
jgi:hypothetical protein